MWGGRECKVKKIWRQLEGRGPGEENPSQVAEPTASGKTGEKLRNLIKGTE